MNIMPDYRDNTSFIPGISLKDIKDILFPEDLIREGKKERVLEIISEHKDKIRLVLDKEKSVNNDLIKVNSLFDKIGCVEAAVDSNFKKFNRLLEKAKNVKVIQNETSIWDHDDDTYSILPRTNIKNIKRLYKFAKQLMCKYREYMKAKGKSEFEYESKLKEILNKKTGKFQIQFDNIYEEIVSLQKEVEKLKDDLEYINKNLMMFICQFEVKDSIDATKAENYFEYISKYEEELKSLNKDYEKYIEEYKDLAMKYSKMIVTTSKIKNNCKEYIIFLRKTKNLLDNLDEEFEKETELDSIDNAFLYVAIGLQILRQFLLTSFPVRLSDKEVAKKVKGNKKEKSDRDHDLYNPSLKQIILNPVPFDAVHGAKGKLKGGNHRFVTLGHDPILGLVFGTANIATSTLTRYNFTSYHIKTNDKKVDSFFALANTFEIFQECFYKMQDIEGMKKLVVSLSKEIIHLKSDLTSTLSLPIPFSQVISPEFASKLAKYGLDSANVATIGEQVAFAQLINTFIRIFHQLLFTGDYDSRDFQLYSVKTKKIIMISGALSSLVNLAYVFGTNDYRKLDIGGIGVTIRNFITMKSEIDDLKTKYIFETYLKELEKTAEEIDEKAVERESKDIYDKIINGVFDITDEEIEEYNSSFEDIKVCRSDIRCKSYAIGVRSFSFSDFLSDIFSDIFD